MEHIRGGVGVGGGWEAEGGPYHPQRDKLQCCVLSKAQKQLQSHWYYQMAISSSLTPLATQLMPLSGSIYIPCSGLLWLYRVGKMLPVKADLAIYSSISGVSG